MSYTQATLRATHLLCGLVVKGDLDGDACAGQHVQQLAIVGLHTHRHTPAGCNVTHSYRLHSMPGMEGSAGLKNRTEQSAPLPTTRAWLPQLWCIHCVVRRSDEHARQMNKEHGIAACACIGAMCSRRSSHVHCKQTTKLASLQWTHHLQIAQQGLHGLLLHVQLSRALAYGQGAVPGQDLLGIVCSTEA